MSVLQFISSTSGIPLYSLFSDVSFDLHCSISHVCSLNGAYIFAKFRCIVDLTESGNGILHIFWKSNLSLNIILCTCEPSSYDHLDTVISMFEDLLSLFSQHRSFTFSSCDDHTLRSIVKYSSVLQKLLIFKYYGIQTTELSLACDCLFPSVVKTHRLLWEDVYACFTTDDEILFRSKNWNGLKKNTELYIIHIIFSLQPFSMIDLPIFIHTLVQEPLRLFSIQLSKSLFFIGLFGSDFHFDDSNYYLENIPANSSLIIENLCALVPNCQLNTACIAYLKINSLTEEYVFVRYFHSTFSNKSKLKNILFETYYSYFKMMVRFHHLLSPFHKIGSLLLKFEGQFIEYQNLFLYLNSLHNFTHIFIFPNISLSLMFPLNLQLVN